jgi:hypothetical protein
VKRFIAYLFFSNLILLQIVFAAENAVINSQNLVSSAANLEHYRREEIKTFTAEQVQNLNFQSLEFMERIAFTGEHVDASGRLQFVNRAQANLILQEQQTNSVTSKSSLFLYDPNQLIGFCFGRAFFNQLNLLRHNVSEEAIRKVFLIGSIRIDVAGEAKTFTNHVATMVRTRNGEWLVLDDNIGQIVTLREWYQAWHPYLDPKVRIYFSDSRRFSANIGEIKLGNIDLPDFGLQIQNSEWGIQSEVHNPSFLKRVFKFISGVEDRSEINPLLYIGYRGYFSEIIRYFKMNPVSASNQFIARSQPQEFKAKILVQQEKKIPVRIVLTIDWEGRDLQENNLLAMNEFRVQLESFLGIQVSFVHFLSAAYFTKPGVNIMDVQSKLKLVIRPQDEIGIHDHMWKSLLEVSGVKYRDVRRFMETEPNPEILGDVGGSVDPLSYSLSERIAIIKKTKNILQQNGFNNVKTYRAAGWSLTPELMRQLPHLGIRVDSSMAPIEMFRTYFPPDSSIRQQAEKINVTTHYWNQIPYSVQTESGSLTLAPLLAMADYQPQNLDEIMLYLFEREADLRMLQEVNQEVSPITFVLGAHQETFANYGPRLLTSIQTFVSAISGNGQRSKWKSILNKIIGDSKESHHRSYNVEIGIPTISESVGIKYVTAISNVTSYLALPKVRLLRRDRDLKMKRSDLFCRDILVN